jgi:membrane protease subunit HflK
MERLGGFYDRIVLAMAGKRSPWGKGPDGEGEEPVPPAEEPTTPPSAEQPPRGPRNPWLPGGGGSDDRGRRAPNIEDIFRQRGPEGPRRRPGGSGGPNFRLPTGPGGRSIVPIAAGVIAVLWLGASSIHQIAPREQAVVTTLGKYSRTLSPGLNMTLPWPLQTVSVEDVSQIRGERIPDGTAE